MPFADRWFRDEIYPAHKIAALVQGMDGVDPAAILAGTGIAAEQLQSPRTRVSYRQTKRAFLNAHQLMPGAGCGFRAGEHMRVTAYGMYGYALLSSRSHEDALQFGLKYHRVMGPLSEMAYAEEGDEAVFVHTPLLTRDPADDLYRLSVEFQLSSHYTVSRDLYGSSFRLSQLRLAYTPSERAGEYEKVFQCPVLFGQARNELRYRRHWMQEPMPCADAITNAMALEACEKALALVCRTGGVAGEIYRILLEQPGRFPNMDAVAEALKTNARALRRQLRTENQSYRNILTEARMRLAVEYLENTDMTNEEIASRLGYSEAANFRHAFTRWWKCSPSHYRKR